MKTGQRGKALWNSCTRIVTDTYDAFPRGTNFKGISTIRLAVWPSHRGGTRPAFPFPAKALRAAATIFGRIGTNSQVRTFGNGHGTLGVFPEHEARHAQGSGFFLDAALLQALLSPWAHGKNDGHFHRDGVDRRTAPHFMHERRNFWEIGTRPDDIHYFQMLAHEAYASRVSTQYSIGELDFRCGKYAIHTKKAPFQCGSIRF